MNSVQVPKAPHGMTHIIPAHFSLAVASHLAMSNFKVDKGLKLYHVPGRRIGIFVHNLDSSLPIWSQNILCTLLPTCKVHLSLLGVDGSAVSSSDNIKLNLWNSGTCYQFLSQRMLLGGLYFRHTCGSQQSGAPGIKHTHTYRYATPQTKSQITK